MAASSHGSIMRMLTARSWRVPLGILLVGVASFASARLFAGTEVRSVLPLAFIAVLFALGRRYGTAVASVGSLLCAVIFAHWLYDPVGSWHVDARVDRLNLLWMVMGAIALSNLFAPTQKPS
jgi:K+-sensing histidine kinase KdpD